MANELTTSELLSREAAARFRLNNSFFATASNKYDGMFTDRTYESGQSVNIRLKNFGKVQRGDTVTVVDVLERFQTLTLKPLYSYPVAFTTTDLTTDMRVDWLDRVFYPGVDALVSNINRDIALEALSVSYNWTGNAGTYVNSFGAVDTVSAQMDEMAIPMYKRYMCLNPANSSALKISLQNAFNQTLNTGISLQSKLGHLSTFDMFSEQLIPTHTAYAGALGTPIVNGPVTSGNTIVLSGLTASITGIFKAGDVIEIDDVYKVDPIAKSDTGRKMQFVITADADSDIGGACTILVSPTIIGDSTNPNQNIVNRPPLVTNEVPNGAAITRPATHKANFAYTEESLYIVTPPLAQMRTPNSYTHTDKETGISVRVSEIADVLNNKNIMRIDVLTGFTWIPTHLWRVISTLD